jgi:hypothetical protein
LIKTGLPSIVTYILVILGFSVMISGQFMNLQWLMNSIYGSLQRITKAPTRHIICAWWSEMSDWDMLRWDNYLSATLW